MTTIQAYKGFNKDLTCRGFQFEEGKTYEHDGPVEACRSGFHATTMPLDVLKYYKPNQSVYHLVELEDVDDSNDEDSKVAARKIKIGAKLDLTGLIKAQVDFVFKNSKPVAGATSKKANAAVKAEIENGAATASGYYGAATASGRYGAATASGRYGAATASGRYGAATASGDYGAATASGRYGAATASGDSGAATASGDYGAATASGDYGAATASGDYGAATASGDSGAATASGRYGAATASGYKSVASATGYAGRARGKAGTALLLVERDIDWNITAAAGVVVDGKKIKADTWYVLRGGKVVEV
ncbi:DUF7666 domain-containing protein [Microbacterium jejuense]|uniref:DUF7666 domain-containing protein n=1 Tax=Microbacterium jejuense TaxID=1263637 RepID=UPI0031E89EDE